MRKLVPPFGIKDRLDTPKQDTIVKIKNALPPRAKPSLERTFFWKAKIVKVKEVTKGKGKS